MNSRGVFFSIMLLFLVLTIISLNNTLSDVRRDFDLENSIQLMRVTNRSDNIEKNILCMKKDDYAREVFEKVLPFNYEINDNSLTFKKTFSHSVHSQKEVINMMNLSKIFLEDEDYSNFFDGIKTDINLSQKVDWSSNENNTEKEISVAILPACYSYTDSLKKVSLKKLGPGECNGDFDSGKVEKINVRLNFAYTEANYNSVHVTGPTNSGSNYFSLDINQDLCTNCNIDNDDLINNFNFDPNNDFKIVVYNEEVELDDVNNFVIEHLGNLEFSFSSSDIFKFINLEIDLVFEKEPENILIRGFDYVVSIEGIEKKVSGLRE